MYEWMQRILKDIPRYLELRRQAAALVWLIDKGSVAEGRNSCSLSYSSEINRRISRYLQLKLAGVLEPLQIGVVVAEVVVIECGRA